MGHLKGTRSRRFNDHPRRPRLDTPDEHARDGVLRGSVLGVLGAEVWEGLVRESEGEVNEDQFQKARVLKSAIGDVEGALEALSDEVNDFDIPEEMFARHQAEKRAFLEGELQRLKAEFEAL